MRDSKHVFKVSELTDEMRRLMETSYPQIWIEGELSSVSTPASGHIYFNLKDESSQIRCAMFKGRASINRYKAKAGDLVRVRAKISVYGARGDLQAIIQHMEEAGEGLLQRRFEELKTKLNSEGLFDQSEKTAIPDFPKHIGLITSPSGAAVKDILSTLKRRCPGIPVTLYPAVVQGESAADSLLAAIANAIKHERCDVILISRGGGSLEDLWCFNHESLARAIFDCPIPIVSGVGHEVDVTICDLVADLRAATPTAAAELLSPDMNRYQSQLASLAYRLPRSFERMTQSFAQKVDLKAGQLVHPKHKLSLRKQATTELTTRMQRSISQTLNKLDRQYQGMPQRLARHSPQRRIGQLRTKLAQSSKEHRQALSIAMDKRQQLIAVQSGKLHAVSPLATLDRGYAIAKQQDQKIVRSSSELKVDDRVSVQLSDGSFDCKVEKLHAK